MGYHFAIDEFTVESAACPGDSVFMNVTINNIGVAPIYKKIPFVVKLSGIEEAIFETDIDVRSFMPGISKRDINIILPENMKSGEYTVNIGILGGGYPTVYFATDAKFCDGYYEVGSITVK